MGATATSPPVRQNQREELMVRLFGDLQRARFNELYYQSRAASMQGWARALNMVAALAASGAFITLLMQSSPYGPLVAKTLAGVAVAIGVIRPFLDLESKQVCFEKAALGHSVARNRLAELLRDLKLKDLDDTHRARAGEIDAWKLALSALDEPPHKKTREAAWNTMLLELPADKAWDIV
jgi:hypothetical protein